MQALKTLALLILGVSLVGGEYWWMDTTDAFGDDIDSQVKRAPRGGYGGGGSRKKSQTVGGYPHNTGIIENNNSSPPPTHPQSVNNPATDKLQDYSDAVCPTGLYCISVGECKQSWAAPELQGVVTNNNYIPCNQNKICCPIPPVYNDALDISGSSPSASSILEPVQLPETQCSEGWKCVSNLFCDATSTMVQFRVELTQEERNRRGELTPCMNQATQQFDVCCRKPVSLPVYHDPLLISGSSPLSSSISEPVSETLQLPETGCSEGWKCVRDLFCDASGTMVQFRVELTQEEERRRGNLTPCMNQATSQFDVCCRKPGSLQDIGNVQIDKLQKQEIEQTTCPVINILPPISQCQGRPSNCWSIGIADTDCVGDALCCFDGCANVCQGEGPIKGNPGPQTNARGQQKQQTLSSANNNLNSNNPEDFQQLSLPTFEQELGASSPAFQTIKQINPTGYAGQPLITQNKLVVLSFQNQSAINRFTTPTPTNQIQRQPLTNTIQKQAIINTGQTEHNEEVVPEDDSVYGNIHYYPTSPLLNNPNQPLLINNQNKALFPNNQNQPLLPNTQNQPLLLDNQNHPPFPNNLSQPLLPNNQNQPLLPNTQYHPLLLKNQNQQLLLNNQNQPSPSIFPNTQRIKFPEDNKDANFATFPQRNKPSFGNIFPTNPESAQYQFTVEPQPYPVQVIQPSPVPVQQPAQLAASQPFVTCPSAMKCVQRINCNFNGVMVEDKIFFTQEQELQRVPLIPCFNTARSNAVDVCCRDPNYKDPWSNNGNENNEQLNRVPFFQEPRNADLQVDVPRKRKTNAYGK